MGGSVGKWVGLVLKVEVDAGVGRAVGIWGAQRERAQMAHLLSGGVPPQSQARVAAWRRSCHAEALIARAALEIGAPPRPDSPRHPRVRPGRDSSA